ncbi:MAG: phospho-N-acetylmuramoyl-pentapeptide-transferase [bacterium]
MVFVFLFVLIILCFWVYRLYVDFLGYRVRQYIREDAPEHHKFKGGTPTAGGVVFTFFIIIFSFLVNFYYSIPLFEVFIILLFGSFFIGFYDDLMKILNRRNLGIRARDKLFFQFIISLIVFVLMKFNNDYFLGNFSVNFSSLIFHDNVVELGWFYLVFLYFLVAGVSNSTNLTDGLDGLLGSLSVFTLLGFLLVFVLFGNLALVYLVLGVIGFILVFLYYNLPKAKIFMGDSGSMVIGALFVYFSIILKLEAYFLFLGYLYFLVALSVILQVLYFKITKGRRLFNFTPLHHHFEMMGYSEKDILKRFNFVNLVFILIGLFFVVLKLYT